MVSQKLFSLLKSVHYLLFKQRKNYLQSIPYFFLTVHTLSTLGDNERRYYGQKPAELFEPVLNVYKNNRGEIVQDYARIFFQVIF
jgi:hypothetical protein